MPGIPSPHFFGVKAAHQLTENCLNSIMHMLHFARSGLFLSAGELEGNQQPDTALLQVGNQFWVPIVAVCQALSGHSLQHFFGNILIREIGGGQAKPDDHARPGDPHMCSQAEKGLSSHPIMPKGCPTRDQF